MRARAVHGYVLATAALLATTILYHQFYSFEPIFSAVVTIATPKSSGIRPSTGGQSIVSSPSPAAAGNARENTRAASKNTSDASRPIVNLATALYSGADSNATAGSTTEIDRGKVGSALIASGGKDNDPNQSHVNATSPSPPTLQGKAVLHLYGQLGNHMSILAYFFAVKTIAEREFDLELTLHVVQQSHGQAISAAEDARCLTSFKDLEFEECSFRHGDRKAVCEMRLRRQREVLGGMGINADELRLGAGTSDEIRKILTSYVDLLNNETVREAYSSGEAGWGEGSRRPFLFTEGRAHIPPSLVDDVHDEGLAEYFAFDEGNPRCCRLLPESNEHVFHYRAFDQNLRKRHRQWGGAELAPRLAANDLLGHLRNGSRVALVGMAHNDRYAAYKEAFENRSLVVREVVGQTSVQDFCFMARARAGLYGTTQSTYASWAALINPDLLNASLYVLNYPLRDAKNVTAYAPKNEHLARVVHHPVYYLTDEDVWRR